MPPAFVGKHPANSVSHSHGRGACAYGMIVKNNKKIFEGVLMERRKGACYDQTTDALLERQLNGWKNV
jgi:hypothetical protein